MKAAASAFSLLSVCLLCAAPLRAQLPPMSVTGDARAALEKDWGPLPVPTGATYDQACSTKQRTAIFSLGLKVDPAAYSRARSDAQAKEAAWNADRAAGRPATMDQLLAARSGMLGTAETHALVEKVASFLKSKGMVQTEEPGLLQMPGNSEKATRLGYTLAAHLNEGGILGVCGADSGPTVQFGRR